MQDPDMGISPKLQETHSQYARGKDFADGFSIGTSVTSPPLLCVWKDPGKVVREGGTCSSAPTAESLLH